MNSENSKSLSSIPWWLVLIQAIASILVGLMVLLWPGTAIIVFVRLLGWYWLIKGIFSLTAIFNPETKAHRGWLIFNSVLGIVAGFAVLDHPLMAAVFVPSVLITFVGIAGVLIGVNDLLAAFRGGGWGVAVLGVISLGLGVVLLGNTLVGVAVLPWIIGITELLGGIVAFFFAFRLLGIQKLRRSAAEAARTS
jgi:uncharacterized membrane protein HdeD (DUF308 family)